jgi:hypothetical protein
MSFGSDDKKKSILDLKKDADFRSMLVDTLCQGIRLTSDFRDIVDYVIDNKLHLFETDEFSGSFYLEDDDTLDLIFPAIRRVWGKIFVDPPQILKEKKLVLFQLLFDIDDFINYLLDIMPKVKTSLIEFDKLDRTAETLILIVDNYIAGLLEATRNREDIQQEIRDLRISKTLRKW